VVWLLKKNGNWFGKIQICSILAKRLQILVSRYNISNYIPETRNKFLEKYFSWRIKFLYSYIYIPFNGKQLSQKFIFCINKG
jgi:hypothetical protein